MNIGNIMKGKTIPLGVISLIIIYLVSGMSSTIYPFVLIVGMFAGYAKNTSVADSAIAGLITSVIGGIVNIIIELGLVYYSYGSTYLNYMIYQSTFSMLFYIVIGLIGGIMGYYINKEINNNNYTYN